jgi:hypothetical protein
LKEALKKQEGKATRKFPTKTVHEHGELEFFEVNAAILDFSGPTTLPV